MFNLRKFLILLGSFLFLTSIIGPLVMVPLLLLIAAASPLLGALLLGIWFKRKSITKSPRATTTQIDPNYYGDRICPGCVESVSKKETVCTNCYKDLTINCPACGKILYIKRRECPACGETLQAGTKSPSKITRRKLIQKEFREGVKPPSFKIESQELRSIGKRI